MQMITTAQLLNCIVQELSLYLIVDINQYQDPVELLKQIEAMESLPIFRGTPYQELIAHSPKLVKLNTQSQPLVDDVLQRLNGCVMASALTIEQLNQTLGEMLLAEHETEGKIYMRFFSPAMARTILQSATLTHCWRSCTQVWLPCYRREKWVEFERPEYKQPSTLQITSTEERQVHAEHLAYLLAKTEPWQGLPIETLKLATQSLARLNAYERLSAKKINLWATWLANNPTVMTHSSWVSLLNNPISNQDKWQSAQLLICPSAEAANV